VKKTFVFALVIFILVSSFMSIRRAGASTPQRFTNLVKNPWFEEGLTGWETLATMGAEIAVESSPAGNSVRISRSQYGYGYAKQRIDMGNVSAKYMYAEASAMSQNATASYQLFDFFVSVYYDDGTSVIFVNQFSHGTHDWEIKFLSFTVDDTKRINFIDFFVRFQDDSGIAWFDNVYLGWIDTYVRVKCTDKSFQSLSFALVKVYSGETFLIEKYTDENGTADFVLPIHEKTFIVYWGGQIMAKQDFDVTQDTELLISSEVSAEIAEIRITLRDILNRPLPNTNVQIHYRPLKSPERFSSQQFLTDANGKVDSLVLLGSGEIVASIVYDGSTYEARTTMVATSETNVELHFNFVKLGSLVLQLDRLVLYVVLVFLLVVCTLAVSHTYYVRRRTVKMAEASGMGSAKKPVSISLYISRVAYLSMVAVSFYLLFVSRSDEVYTVWEVLNPLFMPLFLASVVLLLAILLSHEKVEYKLLFVMFNAILSHSFYFMIYPASTVAGDAANILGSTRRVFDNISSHGIYGVMPENLPLTLYLWVRGDNFHPAITVVFARMFGIDVYWIQALLLQFLWGIFIPLISFKLTSKLGQSQNVSILASLMVSAFPAAILWGAVFTPNSLGFLFFLCAVLFSLNYIASGGSKTLLLMAAFSIVSFMAHFLTGVMSFSFLFLALALRRHKAGESKSIVIRKGLMPLAVILSASLLLLALVSQRLVYPILTYFSLDRLRGLSVADAIWLAILGDFVESDIRTAMFNLVIPLIGLVGMIYILSKTRDDSRIYSLFLFLIFSVVSVDFVIMRLFMVGVPFGEGRILVLRDLVAVPFVAIVAAKVFSFLREVTTGYGSLPKPSFKVNVGPKFMVVSLMIILVGSGWVTSSIYYAYPEYRLLQTTSYELEAARFIDMTTKGSYVVICDEWFVFAGEAIVGVYNPRAYYFANYDSLLISLYNRMLTHPSPDPLVESMEATHSAMGTTYTGATVAYFVIERPRMSETEFNRVLQQAYLALKVYGIFGDGKLYIFYYQKHS
jgi:hypothetical protein